MRGLVGVGLAILTMLAATSANAQAHFDYSGQLDPAVGGVDSSLAFLPPWPLVPWTFSPPPNVIGRFWGQTELTPAYYANGADFGLTLGLYSNENTGNIGSREVAPIDNYNFNLTRIKPQTPLDFEELALFYAGSYGRLELGWGPGVSERTAVSGPHDYGLGGYAGDFPYYLDKPEDVGFNTISSYGSANTSPRVFYLSPRFGGMQIGVSYQPDTRDTNFQFQYGGTEMGVLGREPTPSGTYEAATVGFDNVFEAAANYDQTFGDFRLQASLGAIRGQAIQSPTGVDFHDLSSYQAGFEVTWRGWSIGGGGVYAGNSGVTDTPVLPKRVYAFDLDGGVQYATGPWIVGLGMLYSNDPGDPAFRSDRQMHVYSLGATYKINKDFDIDGEFDRIQTESAVYGDYANYLGLLRLRYTFGGTIAAAK